MGNDLLSCACLPGCPLLACPAVEAMRLYVRTLEEEVADWWSQHTASSNGGGAAELSADAAAPAPTANGDSGAQAEAPAAPQAAGAAAAAVAALRPKSRSVAEVVVEGSWVSPYISSDKRPPPRYEHATAIIGSELFIVGGNYGAPACPPAGSRLLPVCCSLWFASCWLSGLLRARVPCRAWFEMRAPCHTCCPMQVGATLATPGLSTLTTLPGGPSPAAAPRLLLLQPARAVTRQPRRPLCCQPSRAMWRCPGAAMWCLLAGT
jgi:hypothetical protein